MMLNILKITLKIVQFLSKDDAFAFFIPQKI